MTYEYWEGEERRGDTRLLQVPHLPTLEAILMTWNKSVIFAEKLLENEESLSFRIRRELEILCYNLFISEAKKGWVTTYKITTNKEQKLRYNASLASEPVFFLRAGPPLTSSDFNSAEGFKHQTPLLRPLAMTTSYLSM